MDYSPLNLIVWGLFSAFAAIVWIVARGYARRHPEYPGDIPDRLE